MPRCYFDSRIEELMTVSIKVKTRMKAARLSNRSSTISVCSIQARSSELRSLIYFAVR
jgi:hypothetical protein